MLWKIHGILASLSKMCRGLYLNILVTSDGRNPAQTANPNTVGPPSGHKQELRPLGDVPRSMGSSAFPVVWIAKGKQKAPKEERGRRGFTHGSGCKSNHKLLSLSLILITPAATHHRLGHTTSTRNSGAGTPGPGKALLAWKGLVAQWG